MYVTVWPTVAVIGPLIVATRARGLIATVADAEAVLAFASVAATVIV